MAKKTKKAAKKPASGLSEQSGGAEERHEPSVDGTAATNDSRSLPDPQVRVVDVEVIRSLIEALVPELVQQVIEGLQGQLHGSEQAARTSAPAQPHDDNAMGRLLATTSDIRERDARLEQNQKVILANQEETLRRVTVLEANQRPPEPAPDREAAAREAMGRLILANVCRASNLIRPTPAIVGRVMHDKRSFDQRTAKSPQELFLGILDTVRSVFGPAATQSGQEAAAPGQDYVHLTEEIVEILEERSSRPKKKWSEFLNEQLKRRLELLANSGLAHEVPKRVGARTNYDRYLTTLGLEVFNGWPDWTDATGGISLAEGRLQTDATPNATSPATPPDQPAPSGPTEPTPPAT